MELVNLKRNKCEYLEGFIHIIILFFHDENNYPFTSCSLRKSISLYGNWQSGIRKIFNKIKRDQKNLL